MTKPYGFKEKDVAGLSKFLRRNKNLPLSRVFEKYAKVCGKQKGTVRNLYYAIAKTCKEDMEFCNKYFGGLAPKINKIIGFSETEVFDITKNILAKRKAGMSVRKAVFALSNGDTKLALRYQNKYRSILRNKNLQEKLSSAGLDVTQKNNRHNNSEKYGNAAEYFSAMKENETLKKRISDLEEENRMLNEKLNG